MNKRFFIILALLLFSWEAWAISAQEAVNFATKQNNLLYEAETKGEIYPNTRISDKGKGYWVITALSGDSLSGFIPILDKASPSIPSSIIVRRNLIKTAYVLRYYLQLKIGSGDTTQKNYWLFNAENVNWFSDLSTDLKNEKIDLITVKTSLADFPALQAQTDSLSEQLDEMFPLAEEISDELLEFNDFESEFIAAPDTNNLEEFEKKFQTVFELIKQLDIKRATYLDINNLDKLRRGIGETDLPLETRQGLNSIANIPKSFQEFSSTASLSVRTEEKINQIFNNAYATVESLSADLLTREKRNNAFQVMYGYDEEVLLKTGQNTLNQLFELLLDNEYFFLWVNQADLLNAKQDWEKAKSFYDSGEFQQAEQYAAKAKKPALSAYEAGLKSQQPVFDTDLIFGVIALLIIAVIIIYVLKNRGRISDLVSSKEEEVQLRDWSE